MKRLQVSVVDLIMFCGVFWIMGFVLGLASAGYMPQ